MAIKVSDKLEEMLKFFRQAPIKNEDSLTNINVQLEDMKSSLKYVPTEPTFDSLPTEIKTDILSYLCDSGTFVSASVSQEWNKILERNLKLVDHVILGKHCSNSHECEDTKCFMPEEFLKAAVTHKLDVPLTYCHPLPKDIDKQLIVEGLACASNLRIRDDCDCNDEGFECDEQFEHLIEELEKNGKNMDSLELIDMELGDLDQSKLLNFLLNKVKKLTLDDCENGEMFDNKLFLKSLLRISTDSQLTCLTLRNFEYPSYQKYPKLCTLGVADAMCKVPSINLAFLPPNRKKKTVKRVIKNIQNQNVRIKNFELGEDIDWRDVISPEELKNTLEKMDKLVLIGTFTVAQVEAAKSLLGIEASLNKISKCSV